jgi:hypothetical protein
MPAILTAECGGCDAVFTSDPDRVPCFPVNRSKPRGVVTRLDPAGKKQPFCRECFKATNALRAEAGLPPNQHLRDAWGMADE